MLATELVMYETGSPVMHQLRVHADAAGASLVLVITV